MKTEEVTLMYSRVYLAIDGHCNVYVEFNDRSLHTKNSKTILSCQPILLRVFYYLFILL